MVVLSRVVVGTGKIRYLGALPTSAYREACSLLTASFTASYCATAVVLVFDSAGGGGVGRKACVTYRSLYA